jgi:hypothetical protein
MDISEPLMISINSTMVLTKLTTIEIAAIAKKIEMAIV